MISLLYIFKNEASFFDFYCFSSFYLYSGRFSHAVTVYVVRVCLSCKDDKNIIIGSCRMSPYNVQCVGWRVISITFQLSRRLPPPHQHHYQGRREMALIVPIIVAVMISTIHTSKFRLGEIYIFFKWPDDRVDNIAPGIHWGWGFGFPWTVSFF